MSSSSHQSHPAGAARNRLASERSPYLLQHAGNPVDWWPWGCAAVDEARRRKAPLFVSIGYATCHWCHVMARESFEDSLVASRLAEHFVSVKVDREERPEVDEVCMTACQIFTQLVEGRASGGWPLSIWLEPESLMPFFVGTYFPPAPMHGRPSFTQVVEALGTAWRNRPTEVVEQAKRLGALILRQLTPDDAPAAHEAPHAAPFDAQIFAQLFAQLVELPGAAATRLMAMHDRVHGGFGSAPKFPQSCFLELLLEVVGGESAGPDAGARGDASHGTAGGSGSVGRASMLDAVRRTLVAMASGGIFDQVGGGFHRYAVDHSWTVPHFEKMLYDNGQLASLYARAARVFDEPRFMDIARRTCEFVLRELKGSDDGFFCAIDAEANGHEGEGYVWTRDAFERALRDRGLADDIEWASGALGVAGGPNFRDPHDAEAAPSNVLVDRVTFTGAPDGGRLDLASSAAPPDPNTPVRLERVRTALLDARDAGPRPSIDDKIIPAWNGFMIEGMAETARAMLQRGSSVDEASAFASAAARAASFILHGMRRADGELVRVWRGGPSEVAASLEDYASMSCGLLSLTCLALEMGKRGRRDAGDANDWIAAAKSLLAEAEIRFADERGGWFDAAASELLFVRARSLDDGALPSGTSRMIEAHWRLAEHETWSVGENAASRRKALLAHPSIERIDAALRSCASTLLSNPLASTSMLATISKLARARADGNGTGSAPIR